MKTLGKLDVAVLAQHTATVVAMLKDPLVQVRMAAKGTVQTLLQASSRHVRQQAVQELGELDSAALAPLAAAVVAMLKDNKDVRWAALQTLGKLDAAVLAQHAAAVVAMLKHSDTILRRAAVEMLGKLDAAALVALGVTCVTQAEVDLLVAELRVSKWSGRDDAPPPPPAKPAERSYYAVLGVAESAGADEIRKAYKQLALKYHPDKNNGSEKQAKWAQALFVEVQKAYDTLYDASARHAYDFDRGLNSASARHTYDSDHSSNSQNSITQPGLVVTYDTAGTRWWVFRVEYSGDGRLQSIEWRKSMRDEEADRHTWTRLKV